MPEFLSRCRFVLALLLLSAAVPLSAQPTVSGTVLDLMNRPIADARIELLPVPSNYESGRLRLADRNPEPLARTRSDATGRFVLRAPGAGVFKVLVRAEGWVPMQHTPVPLVEDEELPPVVLSPDAGARLRVTSPSGSPLAGLWLFAAGSRASEGGAGEDWQIDFRVGRTGADGSLTLPRLAGEKLDVSAFPPGGVEETRRELEGGTIIVPDLGGEPCRLHVVHAAGVPAREILIRTGDLSWPVGLTDAEGRLQIPCQPGEPIQVRLVAPDGHRQTVELPASAGQEETSVVLSEPAVVSGRLTSGGNPLPGALVRAGADPGAFVLTGADGRYRLVAPDVGFQLLAVAPQHLPRSVRITWSQVRSGRAPAVALTPAAILRGQVVDSQGAPLSGVTLAAAPEPVPGLVVTATNRTVTDAAGRFELRRMRTGRGYELTAQRPGYLPAIVQAVAPGHTREAPPLKIVLTLARAAQGRVQDVDGRPVAGAEVSLSASRTRRSVEVKGITVRTDEKGRFTVAQIPANPLDLAFHKQGYARAFVRGTRVSPGAGTADLGSVVLRPGASLTGRVVDRKGKPIPGAEVFQVEDLARVDEISGRLASDEAAATTGPEGRFALEDLPAGSPINLLVRAPGFLPAGVRGARAPNREPLAVRLETAALLRGRVIDEEKQPVPGARLELVVKTDHPVARLAVTERDGSFEISDAPRGSGALDVQAQGFVPIEDLDVTLPRPQPGSDLILTLERGAVLNGHVSLTDGTPVAGARISAAGSSAFSDDDGAYAVEGVAPGPAIVSVSHSSYRRFSKEMVIEPGANQLDVTFGPGVEVAGRIVDERGAPVSGAWVQLSSQPRGELEYRARAATDGTFRLSPVAQGRYRLRAGHEDYSPAELKRLVLVADEPVGGLEMALSQGGAIVGRVLGLKREELAQVAIRAESAGKAYPAALDSEGRYEVRRLEPGDYLIRASLLAGQRQVQARVSLEPGQREVTRDLEFSRRLTLSGQVLHGDEPLPEAALTLRGNQVAVERSIVTDHQGGFRFEDLEPDTYALGLNHPGQHLVHNENVDLAGDREIVIRLRTATVSGRVQNGENGNPVPGALLLLRHDADAEGPEFLISGGTGQDGSFLLSQVPPGTYRLTASADGYAPGEQEIAVPAGQDVAGLDIALTSTLGLDLTVRLASGKVPGLVNVRVLAASGSPVLAETRSLDPSGALHLATVPEGNWQLLLGAPGGAVAGSPVLVPGEPVAVTLPVAGRLHVRVPALATTNQIATLSLRGSDQQPFWTLGPGGTIRDRWQVIAGNGIVEDLPAGIWQIQVEAPDGHRWTGMATTSGSAETGVALE